MMAKSDGNVDRSDNLVPERLIIPDCKFGDAFEAQDFQPVSLLAPTVAHKPNPNPAIHADRLR
jgi:hypothetical protein